MSGIRTGWKQTSHFANERNDAVSVGQGSGRDLDANPGQARRNSEGIAEGGNPCLSAKGGHSPPEADTVRITKISLA